MAKIDAFLKNKVKFKRETKELDIQKKGVSVTLGALSYDDYMDVQEKSKNGKSYQDIDPFKLQLETVLAGLIDPKPSQLVDVLGSATPKDAIKELFSIGEIGLIANEILELSGFGGDVVDEIKND